MTTQLETSLHELSDIQRKAVEWDDGALLVLAGPGSGRTRVLTCRVARLLDRSPDERFRVLALTFTNKAAHEMSSRLTTLAPGLEERADIQTFHSFCTQVLRQHGVHLGIKPDFAIYSRTSDREAVLEDALARDCRRVDSEDRRLLPRIDALKARLVRPEQTEEWLASGNSAPPDEACRVARAYRLYEEELRRANALDFNSLIFEAHRLFGYPAMARHYQTVYGYWLVDEFQDTNGAQYGLLRRMAGEDFRRVFAVADDDQTIYEWNGANVRRIGTLVEDFDCEVMQLPTNYRCPPGIVEAANRLVVYNARRANAKRPAEPAQRGRSLHDQPIRCRVFGTDRDEAAGIAAEIAGLDLAERGRTLVLARTRALLESMRDALQTENVNATILNRRDDFASPRDALAGRLPESAQPAARPTQPSHAGRGVWQLRAWLHRVFSQRTRAARLRRPAVPFGGGGGHVPVGLDGCGASGRATVARRRDRRPDCRSRIAGELKLASAIDQILGHFESDEPGDDLKDDLSAWRRLSGEIGTAVRTDITRSIPPGAGTALQGTGSRRREPYLWRPFTAPRVWSSTPFTSSVWRRRFCPPGTASRDGTTARRWRRNAAAASSPSRERKSA